MTLNLPDLPDPELFRGWAGGRPVSLFHLSTPGGLRAAVCNHGARLLALVVPGRGGRWHDVVLGYASLPQMLDGMASMGAVIGRFANRIGGGGFTLDGQAWKLPANDGPNCLHGGPAGCRHQVFDASAMAPDHLRLRWTFRQADDGFPGDVMLRVDYRLRDPGVLEIRWKAQALDRATVLNITTHPFFNLEGQGSAHVRAHRVTIDAACYLPVDAVGIPTGAIATVAATPFDLREGLRLDAALAALPGDTGFDHCYVNGMAEGGPLRRAARVEAPDSGIAMEVWSDAPGLQFFSASKFNGSLPRHAGKGGRVYQREAALCLEPQGFPDAPNQPHFPSAALRPGMPRSGHIEYRFSVLDA
ncbi:MAG: aldose epimerase family protein [Pseudomonadota bacterium]